MIREKIPTHSFPSIHLSESLTTAYGHEVGAIETPWQPFSVSMYQKKLAIGSFIQDRTNFISVYNLSSKEEPEMVLELKHDFPPCQLKWSSTGLLASCSQMINVYKISENNYQNPIRLCNGLAVRII